MFISNSVKEGSLWTIGHGHCKQTNCFLFVIAIDHGLDNSSGDDDGKNVDKIIKMMMIVE